MHLSHKFREIYINVTVKSSFKKHFREASSINNVSLDEVQISILSLFNNAFLNQRPANIRCSHVYICIPTSFKPFHLTRYRVTFIFFQLFLQLSTSPLIELFHKDINISRTLYKKIWK